MFGPRPNIVRVDIKWMSNLTHIQILPLGLNLVAFDRLLVLHSASRRRSRSRLLRIIPIRFNLSGD